MKLAGLTVVAGAMSIALSPDTASAEASPATHTAFSSSPWNRLHAAPTAEGRLDPLIFFDELVARYRGLTAYSDLTHIVQITRHYDEPEPTRTETRVACEVADGVLTVITPGAQLRRNFGLTLPVQPSPEVAESKARYDLWLAPHMALKFSEKPLEELREGVPEGFTATDAAAVTINDRPMVHLELTSGDGLSGDYNARFDVYVDPESMLIERIEGRQRLPDGGDTETTYHITPALSEGVEPVRPATSPQPVSTPAEEVETPAAVATPCPPNAGACRGPVG